MRASRESAYLIRLLEDKLRLPFLEGEAARIGGIVIKVAADANRVLSGMVGLPSNRLALGDLAHLKDVAGLGIPTVAGLQVDLLCTVGCP